MIFKANCKINIGLDILRRRDDGFHDIETVMVPLHDIYDVVEVERVEGVSELVATGIPIDCPAEKNLCMRALRLMQSRYDVGDMRIRLDKRVPFGAGLGSGSSDATAVILAVNELCGLKLSELELVALAAELGSDTAFFVRNTPQLCSGRGEVMTPVELPIEGMYLVVAKPDDAVSTRDAYGGVVPSVPKVALVERLSQSVEAWQGSVKNDFEPHVFEAHPAIAELKKAMLNGGAIYASMSGSGSAVYGIFEDKPKLDIIEANYVNCIKL